MNKWQKIFLGLGLLFIVTLCVFPPQIISKQSVQFLPISYGYPVDWFRWFLWLVIIIFVTGLGIITNKPDHS